MRTPPSALPTRLCFVSLALALAFGALSWAGPGPASPATPELHARSNYHWPYDRGPEYGRVGPASHRRPGVLHTRVGSFDLRRGAPELPPALRAGDHTEHFFVLWDPGAVEAGELQRLRAEVIATGGELIRPVPIAGHLARLTPESRALLTDRPGIRA